MAFLHGVETIEFKVGPNAILIAATAVIGLVGTAPIQTLTDATKKTVNTPVLITNDKDAAAYFGADMAGYTIPSALKAIIANGAGPVIVVNVFDPTLPAHQTAGVPDPSKVVAADIIGTTLGTGLRTGLLALLDARPTYGLAPKQVIAPGFTGLVGVMTQMESVATKLRGICWVDAAVGLSPAQAIAARATTLNTASKRVNVCYPHLKVVDGAGATVLKPLSQFAAAACSAKDRTKGYWWSPSNTEMLGLVGLERPIDGTFQDINAELNLLNAAGIVTVYADYGTGYLLWGNRNAAFPGNSEVDSFIAVRRTADIIEEAIERAALKYQDRPITKALIDQLVDDVNEFMRSLMGKGALVDGKAFYDPSKNSSSELSAGHLTVGYRFASPVPLERATFESYLDVTLLSAVNK